MVVIFGQPSDPCASLTDQYLRRAGTEVALIDTSQLQATLGLSWPLGGAAGDGFLLFPHSRVPFAALSGVLARIPPVVPCGPEVPAEDRAYVSMELQAAVLAFLNALPCRVINRPAHDVPRWPIAPRVEQADTIAARGFQLPALLMTSDPERAADFCRRYSCRVLAARPSGRNGWRWVDAGADADRLAELLSGGPLYLQQLPAGEWLQVTTVGDHAFGAAGRPEPWGEEQAAEPLRTVALPSSIQELCCRLARDLRLELAQFQIVRDERGELHCLDVSPWPALDRCETPLQERIALSLVQRLEGGGADAA